MAKKKETTKKETEEVIDEPTLEDLESEELDTDEMPEEEESQQEPETESLEARVESETKKSAPEEDSEGTFMSIDAAEERNVKTSDLTLDTNAMGIQDDEFICSSCFLILNIAQLEKPRAKICKDCA
ncbi:MAG: DUF4193 family protein [Actinomycetota bacterium]|nr:DUF4193 family protein [Actinomycetota bacterium]